MEIRLKIDDLDYGALAVAVLPQLRPMLESRRDPFSRLLSGVAALPPALLKTTINALPQETKDDMVKYLISAKSAAILASAENFAREKGVPVRLGELSVD